MITVTETATLIPAFTPGVRPASLEGTEVGVLEAELDVADEIAELDEVRSEAL